MRFIHDNEVRLRYGVQQHLFGPHISREQDVVVRKGGAGVGNGEFTDIVFFTERLLELFQQDEPMAQNYNLLAAVEAFDDLAREHGFARAGRRLQDKSTVLGNNRWKAVDDFLLPCSEMHGPRIPKKDNFCTCDNITDRPRAGSFKRDTGRRTQYRRNHAGERRSDERAYQEPRRVRGDRRKNMVDA